MSFSRSLTGLLLAGTLAPAALAQPTFLEHTGHFYEYVSAPGLSWNQARTAAEGLSYGGVQGHLVTILSAEENDFIKALTPGAENPWLGASDEDVDGTWRWVTGEIFYQGGALLPGFFADWCPGQPDDFAGAEDYAYMPSATCWNDQPHTTPNPKGFVVEYDTEPPYLFEDTLNHYEYVAGNMNWTAARDAAETHTLGVARGRLVTILSSAENDFIKAIAGGPKNPWLGASDHVVDGTWTWVTGEVFYQGGALLPGFFADWCPGQPDNFAGAEDYAYMPLATCWNDQPHSTPNPKGYVVEYDSSVFSDAGGALAGGLGEPTLRASGPLTGDSLLTLDLDNALPGATAYYVLGLANLGAPFKGGTLVPTPDIVLPLGVDAGGQVLFSVPWPTGLPTGLSTFHQYWIVDAGGPVGFAASNGIQAVTP